VARELQQDMFVEISPADRGRARIRDGAWVLVSGPEMVAGKVTRMKALVTERVGKGVAWNAVPFRRLVPERGPARKVSPRVRSDRARREREHDHDLRIRPVTGMQEPKATLCQIRAA